MRFVFTAILSGIATLFHILFGLMGAVILLIIALRHRSPDGRESGNKTSLPVKLLVYFFVTAGVIIIPYIYVSVYIMGYTRIEEVVVWCFEFSQNGFETSKSITSAIIGAPQGIIRALVGILSWFATPDVKDFLCLIFNQNASFRSSILFAICPGQLPLFLFFLPVLPFSALQSYC